MDFETHADKETIEAFKRGEEVDTGVWLWYLINEAHDYLDDCYGYTLEGFFNRLMKLSQKLNQCLIQLYVLFWIQSRVKVLSSLKNFWIITQ